MVSQSDVARYVSRNPSVAKLLENGKLQFTQTGQEFPPNTPKAVLEAYAAGRAYRRALAARENESYDFSQHEPHIVPHKHRNDNHFLYCTLTNVTLPKRKQVVENHVGGKRFLRQLKELERAKERRKGSEIDGKVGEDAEEKAGEKDSGDLELEKEPDVLDGLLSDSEEADEGNEEMDEDGDAKDENMQDADVPHHVVQLDKMDEEEEEKESGSVFWTRGRARVAESDDDDDDEDEWKTTPKKVPRAAKALGKNRSIRKKAGTERASTGPSATDKVTRDGATQSKSQEADANGSGTKRGRPEKKVGKKTRRPRQRRKMAVQTASDT